MKKRKKKKTYKSRIRRTFQVFTINSGIERV